MDWEGWLAYLLPPTWAAAPRKPGVTDALAAEIHKLYDADYFRAGQARTLE